MLIGIDSSPCSLSLRNRSTLCSTTKCHKNKSDLKNVFVQNFFFQYLLFFQSQSCFLKSTAAIFRQSAGYVFNCSRTKFIAIIVNVCVFFMQNLCLTILTFRVTFTPLTFCDSRDLNSSLNHNFKLLNSIGGKLILKFKWKVRQNWCHFLL